MALVIKQIWKMFLSCLIAPKSQDYQPIGFGDTW